MKIEYQRDQPCGNTLVLTERNEKWMDTIKEYIDSYDCFIAVGLSHLMYECGLIEQLRSLDYVITPIQVKE